MHKHKYLQIIGHGFYLKEFKYVATVLNPILNKSQVETPLVAATMLSMVGFCIWINWEKEGKTRFA